MKFKPTKEIQRIDEHSKKAKSQKFKCFEPNCQEEAIKSHILQKNGILSLISRDNQLYKLHNNLLTQEVKLVKSGINDAFTFKGFCNKHDTSVFATIEQKELDLSNYKTLLLLNYRAILNEKRKKEIGIISINNILKDPLLQSVNKKILNDQLGHELTGIRSLDHYINILRTDLYSTEESFYFRISRIPSLDVCTSSIFTMDTYNETRIKILNRIDIVPLRDIIINIFPSPNETLIILSCLKKDLAKATPFILSLSEDPVKFVSDILIKHVETWVCSPDIYFKIFRTRMDAIGKEFVRYPTKKDIDQPTTLNIFKGWQ